MLSVPGGITTGTAMVEAAVKFVDCAGGRIVPVHKIRVHPNPEGLFTPVADMTDPVGTGPLLLVIQPLQSLERLIDVRPLANHEGVRRRRYGVAGDVCANTGYKHWQRSCTWPWD